MKYKPFASVLLSAILLVSCGSQSTIDNISNETSSDSTSTETEPAPLVPIRDLGGKTFTFYIRYEADGWDWNVSDFIADTQNGEPVNDAVYKRNSRVEDLYNCKIEQVKSGDAWGTGNIKNSILSGDGSYDGTILPGRGMVGLGLEGLLIDLNILPDIDLTKDYWNPKLCEELSLGGKSWYAMGDLSATDNRAVRCLFFNKDLFKKYELENPYELVNNGTWTIDKFLSMVSGGLVDLNGDGQYDENDQWGLYVQGTIGQNLFYATGNSFIAKEKDGTLSIAMDGEKTLAVMSDIADKVVRSKSAINISNDYEALIPLFADGHSLFYSEVSLFLERFRQYEFDVGVLPMPKYDENQADYSQFADGGCMSFAGIPIDSKTPDDTALLLEALSAESVDTLTKAYYDICLTGKSIRDEESSGMLDIIFRSYIVDYADLLGEAWSSKYTQGLIVALRGDKEVASTVASATKMIQKRIDEVNNKANEN